MHSPTQNSLVFRVNSSSSPSDCFSSLKESLVKTPVTMRSETVRSPVLSAKQHSLCPFDERSLLQAPIIATPPSLKMSWSETQEPLTFGRDFFNMDAVASPRQQRVKKEAVPFSHAVTSPREAHFKIYETRSLNHSPVAADVADSPPQARTEWSEQAHNVDWTDLMLWHQDFPYLVSRSSNVAAIDPHQVIPLEIQAAVECLENRLSGKNLTIHRGKYPWVDLKMDVHIDRLRQALEMDDSRSTIAPKSSSIFVNWRKVKRQEKFDRVMASTVDSGERKNLDINNIMETSTETGVPVADIVACIKSRGRKCIKPNALRTSTDEVLHATGKRIAPQIRYQDNLKRRSSRITGIDDRMIAPFQLPVPTTVTHQDPSPCKISTEPKKKRGRPPKVSKKKRGRPPKQPRICEQTVASILPYDQDPEEIPAESPKSFVGRGPRLSGVVTSPLKSSSKTIFDSVMATDGGIAPTPHPLKNSTHDFDIRTVEVPKENNTPPMSCVTFRGDGSPGIKSPKSTRATTVNARTQHGPYQKCLSFSSSYETNWKVAAVTKSIESQETWDALGASWGDHVFSARDKWQESSSSPQSYAPSSGNESALQVLSTQGTIDSDDSLAKSFFGL